MEKEIRPKPLKLEPFVSSSSGREIQRRIDEVLKYVAQHPFSSEEAQTKLLTDPQYLATDFSKGEVEIHHDGYFLDIELQDFHAFPLFEGLQTIGNIRKTLGVFVYRTHIKLVPNTTTYLYYLEASLRI